MAQMAHNQHYSNESHPPLQWHKTFVEGDDDLALDDQTLDAHPLDMAAAEQHQRRQSFASNASLVSPTQQTWSEYAYNAEPAPAYPLNHNAASVYPDNGAHPYPHHNAPPFAQYSNHMAQWQHQTHIASDPTGTTFGALPPDVDAVKPEAPYPSDGHPPQGNVHGGLPMPMDSEYTAFPMSAASPQWSTSSSDAVEKIPRSGQYQSPMFNHNPPHLRRDGVRKKNARFEIPEGRNLQTIDELINNTNPNNEEEIKELKQQKRLLRNRQAALDSRCRKKHHTEKLEEEKKHYLAHIDRLEDENRTHQMNGQRWMEERQHWHHYTENLRQEKEELVRLHTLETAELRRKNTYLSEMVERLEGVAMSAQPSSNGASTGFPEFDNLTMESSPFDDFSFIGNPVMDLESKSESSAIIQPKRESPTLAESADKSAASGLLLMLLLCGAYVASRNSSPTAVIPRMPDDVREASAVVLDNIYKDAGLQPQVNSQSNINSATVSHNALTRTSTNSRPNTSPLASLHHDLVAPTPQQQRDQIFSLSVDQYNHITSDDCLEEQQDASQAPKRRSLSDALSAMRAQKQGTAGEVYTRSLMLDKVPADVVRDFARMMEDSKRGEPIG
ncbi:hypothetical protein ACLMJK_002613 [Lecanora helva]